MFPNASSCFELEEGIYLFLLGDEINPLSNKPLKVKLYDKPKTYIEYEAKPLKLIQSSWILSALFKESNPLKKVTRIDLDIKITLNNRLRVILKELPSNKLLFDLATNINTQSAVDSQSLTFISPMYYWD